MISWPMPSGGFNSDIRNRIGAMGLIAYFINDPLIAQLLCVALAVCAVVGLCGLCLIQLFIGVELFGSTLNQSSFG